MRNTVKARLIQKGKHAMPQHSYFDELDVVFVGHFPGLHEGRPQKRSRFRMGLMTGTNVEKRTGDQCFQTVCPIIFFDFRNEEYCWNSSPNAPRESFFFDIEGARADRIEAMIANDFPKGFLPCRNTAPFRMILDDMNDAFMHYRPTRPYQLPLFAEQFLTQIYSERAANLRSGKYDKRIRDTAALIRNDPGTACDFQKYADELKITLIHYRRIFKSVTGLSPYQYQQKCRLAAAIRLLKNAEHLQLQEIGRICGFQDPAEFSRFFRNQTGLSPQHYCKTFFE